MTMNRKLIRILCMLITALAVSACSGPAGTAPGVTTIVNEDAGDVLETTAVPSESSPTVETETVADAEVSPGPDAAAYAFVSAGTTIRPTVETSEVRALLATARETGEAPSCAFEGLDKVYRFDGFEVQTGMLNGVDYVTGIIILDKDIQTPEGLSIGMSLDEMIDIYGGGYVEDFGQYVYEDEDVRLIIIVDQDEILTISYIGKFEQG